MLVDQSKIEAVASRLSDMFDEEFGGKQWGRYRISEKLMRHLVGRKRLYPEIIQQLQQALFERGFVLIDMDSFFVVIGAKTLASYRRVGPAIVGYTADNTSAADRGDTESDE